MESWMRKKHNQDYEINCPRTPPKVIRFKCKKCGWEKQLPYNSLSNARRHYTTKQCDRYVNFNNNNNKKSKSSKFKSKKNSNIFVQVKKETKVPKVNIEICRNRNHQNSNQKKIIENFHIFLSWRSEGRNFFQIFFFEFLVQNDSIRKKKQKHFFENFDFFSKSKECGGFWPFWPLEREPKFFSLNVR